MFTTVEYEGGKVEVDSGEYRTTLTIRPDGGQYGEVQLTWTMTPTDPLHLIAYDRREKKVADYTVPNDDKARFDQLCVELTNEPLDEWLRACEVPFHPAFRPQVRHKRPRAKKAKVVAPTAKKKPKCVTYRKPRKGTPAFRCHGCVRKFAKSKCTTLDDGKMRCPTCAAVVRAEEHNAAHPVYELPDPKSVKVTSADYRWYVVRCVPTWEQRARRGILRAAEAAGMKHLIRRVLIATNKEIEERGGQRTVRNRKSWNGYLVVNMVYNDELTGRLLESRDVRREGVIEIMPKRRVVTAPSGKSRNDQMEDYLAWVPTELPPEDVELILLRSNKQKSLPRKVRLDFAEGDTVLVRDGQYEDMVAKVLSISGEKTDPVVKLSISILGRPIVVEVPHDHCEKLSDQAAKRLSIRG